MSTPAQIRPDDAVAQNAKLFPILARRLDTTDQTQYTSAAGKLQKWLDSEKAYYPAARPKIVELLEIAWKASRDLAPQAFEHGKPPDRSTYPISKLPTFDAYITLIGTIRQYIRLFSEDDLIRPARQ
ncbi:hypothetical protein BV25DRAFT_1090766 [Artomyces pyxidatus]|uniref:Uncharacterized protein n=1 Tax=Artomyces pyxidatus TaxID=48021 RepID=A0ACB8TFU8_9AGAM|nr:hypothetical protein BV25DRAFT_1090766 [Artomyces pyxidatus]